MQAREPGNCTTGQNYVRYVKKMMWEDGMGVLGQRMDVRAACCCRVGPVCSWEFVTIAYLKPPRPGSSHVEMNSRPFEAPQHVKDPLYVFQLASHVSNAFVLHPTTSVRHIKQTPMAKQRMHPAQQRWPILSTKPTSNYFIEPLVVGRDR